MIRFKVLCIIYRKLSSRSWTKSEFSLLLFDIDCTMNCCISLSICMHFFNPVYFRYDVIKNKTHPLSIQFDPYWCKYTNYLAQNHILKDFLFFFWFFRTFSQSMFKISRILIICLWKRKNAGKVIHKSRGVVSLEEQDTVENVS